MLKCWNFHEIKLLVGNLRKINTLHSTRVDYESLFKNFNILDSAQLSPTSQKSTPTDILKFYQILLM